MKDLHMQMAWIMFYMKWWYNQTVGLIEFWVNFIFSRFPTALTFHMIFLYHRCSPTDWLRNKATKQTCPRTQHKPHQHSIVPSRHVFSSNLSWVLQQSSRWRVERKFSLYNEQNFEHRTSHTSSLNHSLLVIRHIASSVTSTNYYTYLD